MHIPPWSTAWNVWRIFADYYVFITFAGESNDAHRTVTTVAISKLIMKGSKWFDCDTAVAFAIADRTHYRPAMAIKKRLTKSPAFRWKIAFEILLWFATIKDTQKFIFRSGSKNEVRESVRASRRRRKKTTMESRGGNNNNKLWKSKVRNDDINSSRKRRRTTGTDNKLAVNVHFKRNANPKCTLSAPHHTTPHSANSAEEEKRENQLVHTCT